jgi:predicted Rossmann fold nucleotide-binding protein DprA/Smf involved in DNA uptake
MPTASNAVSEAADLLRARLRELDDERAKLERALASLTGGREGRRGPGRPRGSASKPSANGRRRRRRRGGTRADQAVKLVGKSPGLKAADIARELGIKPNYMYRVLADLEKDGRVRKEGRAYHPAG